MTDEELDTMLESGQTDVFTQNVSVNITTEMEPGSSINQVYLIRFDAHWVSTDPD